MATLSEEIRHYTKSSPERILAMKRALRYIDKNEIPGDIVECGVWRGGNIILARKYSPARICWLYDTFEGMLPPAPEDGEKARLQFARKSVAGVRHSAVSIDQVRKNLAAFGVGDPEFLRFVEGDVCKTLIKGPKPERIALLRLDTDWYESTKAELKYLYPLLVQGGVLIIDDYGHWRGCKMAVDEYFPHEQPNWSSIDYTAVALIKRG